MFCQFTRKIGIKSWLCPWMKLGHVGSYVFNGTLPALGNLDFAAHGNDMESRPHNITEEEEKVEEEVGRKLRICISEFFKHFSSHQHKPCTNFKNFTWF